MSKKKKRRSPVRQERKPKPEPVRQSLLLASLGLSALIFQLPLIRMMLSDPRSFFLGSWDKLAYFYFVFVIFLLVPAFVALTARGMEKWKALGKPTLLFLFSVFIVGQAIFFLPHPERLPFDPRSLFIHLLLIGLVFFLAKKFSRFLLETFKVLSVLPLLLLVWFTVGVWGVTFSSRAAAPVQSAEGPGLDRPIFFLTFEKLVLRYVANEKKEILEDQFPNLAAFVQTADFYPNAYANSMATTWSLPILYTGRIIGFTEQWWNSKVDAKEILGKNRKRVIVTDVTQFWCDQSQDNCVRVLGFHRGEIIEGWIKTYLKTILPTFLAGKMKVKDWAFNPWDDMWDAEMANTGDEIKAFNRVGIQQMEKLKSLVDYYEGGPNFYLMHNFISDNPGAKYSQLKAEGPVSFEEDLIKVRERLALFDEKLGEFMGYLKEKGLFDQSLILLTADTGYDPAAGHLDWMDDQSVRLSDTLTRVFLAIKKPNQKQGRRINTEIQQIDVLPTLMTILGMDPTPYNFQGQPASTLPEINHTLRPYYFALGTGRGVYYFTLDFAAQKMRLAEKKTFGPPRPN